MSANMSQDEINSMLGVSDNAGAEEVSQPAELENFVAEASAEPSDAEDTVKEASAEPSDAEDTVKEASAEPSDAEDTVKEASAESPDESVGNEVPADEPTKEPEAENKVNDYLTPEEIDLLGEIGNICMGAVATTMYTLLDRRVSITTPLVEVFSTYDVLKTYATPFIIVDVRYVEGIEGKNLLLLKEHDAMLITDLLMGGDGQLEEGAELNDMHMSAISEVMNQMIGASATAMSDILNRPINISPPYSEWVDIDGDVSDRLDSSELVVKISFAMEIEGLLKSQLLQLMPYQLGRDLSQKMMDVQRIDSAEIDASAAAAPPAAPAPVPASPIAAAPPSLPPYEAVPPAPSPAKLVDVRPANYPAFDVPSAAESLSGKSLDLVADIPLQVSVELGKTKKTISDILEFGIGTIVVLDKIAGEHVEVLVNGKLIAAGEVVVIDENYGVRITDIFE